MVADDVRNVFWRTTTWTTTVIRGDEPGDDKDDAWMEDGNLAFSEKARGT